MHHIEGELDFKWQTCPFREKIPVDEFQKELASKLDRKQDLLAPSSRLAMVRIGFTERCNLRCTYCAASQPAYSGVETGSYSVEGGREIPAELLETIIQARVGFKHIDEIAVNGHGETTTCSGWHSYSFPDNDFECVIGRRYTPV